MTASDVCPNCHRPGMRVPGALVCAACSFPFVDDGGADLTSSFTEAVSGVATVTPRATVRAATAQLAAALAAAGRWRQAATGYETALAEPGDDPAEHELRMSRASCLLAAGADPADVHLDVLAWLAAEPPGWRPIAELVLLTLTADETPTLRPWVASTWLAQLADNGSELRATGNVIAAALHALAGRGTGVVDTLRAAADLDAAITRRLWDRWLEAASSPSGALSSVAGGAAYTTTLRARAEFALGDAAAALSLATSVIDSRMTGERYPELEAYWLRARLPDRTGEQRAADLVATGVRLVWRGAIPDLDAAIEVFDEARQFDSENRDNYWNKAEALRMRSRTVTPANVDDLRAGWGEWQAGRALGPVTDSWAWFVRGQLASDLADAAPREAATWAVEVLASAAECVGADTTWPPGWAFFADALRRARLWTATEWAALAALDVAEELNAGAQYEAVTVARALLLSAPRVYRAHRRAFDAPFGAVGSRSGLFDLLAAVMLDADDPIDAAAVVRTLPDDEPSDKISRARLLLMAGSDTAPDAARIAHEAVDGKPEVLLGVIADYTSLIFDEGGPIGDELRRQLDDPGLWLNPSSIASCDLSNAVLAGDDAAADAALERTTTDMSGADALFTAREFDHVADVLDRRGDKERAARAREIATRLRAADPTAGRDPASVWLALVDLDEHASVAAPEWRPALAAARAFVASRVRSGVAGTDYAASPGVIELSEQLIPVDAGDRWREWVLFAELVPALHAALTEALGFPTSGVTVRPSPDLPARGYRVLVDGLERAGGEVPGDPPDPPLLVAQYPDDRLWREPVAALQRALFSEPAATFLPSVIGQLLDARGVAGHDELTGAQQVAIWQQLRRILDANGHLRDVDTAVLTAMVNAVAGQAAAVSTS